MMGPALVIFQKQLGDTILLEPALSRLANATGQLVSLWCKPSLAPLFELLPQVRPHQPGQRYAHVWVYEKGSKATFRAWLASAGQKKLRLRNPGSDRWYQRLVFDDIQFTPKVNRYFAEWYWEVTNLGQATFRPPQLNPPPPTWAPRTPLPEHYILVNATASEQRKLWRLESWNRVLSALAASTKLPIVLTGSGPEWALDHIHSIHRAAPATSIDLSGKTNLKEFIHVSSRAELVLTVDGACSHLAQAFGKSTATIFSATNRINPITWHYPSQRSFALPEQPDANPLASADRMIDAALMLLNQKSGPAKSA